MSRLKQALLPALNDLEKQALGFRALSGLLNGLQDENPIDLNELVYLLNPLIEEQKALIDRLVVLCHDSELMGR